MSNTTGLPPAAPPPLPQAIPVALEYHSPNAPMTGAYWREGALLRVTDNAALPCRCVKCNSSDDVRMKTKKFTWYPRWVIIIILASLLIGAIVAICLQQRVTVTYGLCARHRRIYRTRLLVSLVAIFGSLGLVIYGGVQNTGMVALFGGIVFFAGLIYAAIALPILQPTEIRKGGTGWLRGCGAAFLCDLPQPASAPPMV